MKLGSASTLISFGSTLLVSSSVGVDAFSVQGGLHHSAVGRSTPVTQLSATVEATTNKLIPPPSIEEVTEHAQSYYDNNVQKTYG